jgi:hypothetical protein
MLLGPPRSCNRDRDGQQVVCALVKLLSKIIITGAGARGARTLAPPRRRKSEETRVRLLLVERAPLACHSDSPHKRILFLDTRN